MRLLIKTAFLLTGEDKSELENELIELISNFEYKHDVSVALMGVTDTTTSSLLPYSSEDVNVLSNRINDLTLIKLEEK